MKESELRQHTVCALCNKKIGHTGIPIFYTVEIRQFGLEAQALRRQQGLTMMLGGHAEIARIMGPDDDLANQIGETTTLTICQNCAVDERRPILDMLMSGE